MFSSHQGQKNAEVTWMVMTDSCVVLDFMLSSTEYVSPLLVWLFMGDMHLSSCASWIGLALAGLVSVGLCVAWLGVWLWCVGSVRLVESRDSGVLELRLGSCAAVYMRPRVVLCCRSCTRRPLSNDYGQVLMWCREPHTCICGTETVEAHGNSFAPLRKKSQMQSSNAKGE